MDEDFILITGRTWQQGATMEGPGKMSVPYQEAVALCEFDEKDMEIIGIKDSDNVKITSEYSSVVVIAKISRSQPHAGQVFIPLGPWANILIGPETHGTGMPSYKGIKVKVEKTGDPVLNIKQLLKEYFENDRN
ncbi:MAG: molybdopterin dinucleotide binding domain-containing protein [Candidatus Hodarchaeales archaeon]